MTDKIIVHGGGGSKGGGGSSHTPVEAPNTFVTKTTARVQFLVSDGETSGLYDQTYPLKSVYLNNVPVMNSDGSMNFNNVQLEERYGLPSQSVMAGYPSVTSSYSLGTKVTTSSPVTWTTTTDDVDAVRVTIRFPALFKQETNGDTNGTDVYFNIYTKTVSGSWTLWRNLGKYDKCISPADADYYVPRPGTTGVWQVRVDRVSPDNGSTTRANDIYFQTATEVKNAQISYDNRAVIGLTISAETTGSSYPTVSFKYKGIKVRVPSNYNPTTRTYTGVWDGTFSSTLVTTSNPIWNLLDMLTHTRHGMGLDTDNVDIYSFYDAAVYCDELVPALTDGAVTGYECRYSFNHQYIEGRDDEWTAAQNLASVADAVIYTSGNLIKLVQDRPTAVSRMLSNSNVVDGNFTYSSGTLPSHYTAAIVYWTDPNQNGTAQPAYYEADVVDIDRFGLNVKEVSGFGMTSEGQAMRAAKRVVETALSNQTGVTFKVGLSNATILPGEVIEIYDSHYAGVVNEAKILSTTSTTLTLDKEVSVTTGDTFTTIAADGVSLEERTISATTTGNVVTFSGGSISAVPGAVVVFAGAISPRTFKVTNIREEHTEDMLQWQVSAVLYDGEKFSRVDDTPAGPVPVFQANTTIPSAPLNLNFSESAVNDNGVVTRKLIVSWTRPAQGTIFSYLLRIRCGSSVWTDHVLKTQSFEISPANNGLYEVEVYAVNVKGVYGPAATGTWDLSIAGTESSPFDAPTTLVEYYDEGTVFSQDDLTFRWTNPSSNEDIGGATLRDFEVKILDPNTLTVLRTEYVEMVSPGSTQYYNYPYQSNLDDGGPRRNVRVEVRIRDTNNNLTDEVAVTFTNPTPGVPPNLSIVTGIGSTTISYDTPGELDYEGVLIWRDTTPNFVLSFENCIFDGTETYIVDGALNPSTKYYYVVGAYDSFAKDYTGAGMNLSSEVGVTVVDMSGQANLVRNSDFNGRVQSGADIYRPIGFSTYSYPWIETTYVDSTGVGSETAFALRADDVSSGSFGLKFDVSETPDNYGVAGGWVAGQDYALSFYAKKINGAGWTGMTTAWDFAPEYSGAGYVYEVLENPTLSTDFQRYKFHFKWAEGSTPEPEGKMYLSVQGSTAVNDVIIIDRVQVELGEAPSGWQPRVDEITPGSITEVYIADDAITTPKLTAEAVTADKIAANTITGNKLVVGTIDKDKLAHFGDVNILDASTWTSGITTTPVGYNLFEGVWGDENSVVLTLNPDGSLRPTWKCTSTDEYVAGTDYDGGFTTDSFTIDPAKMYRFSVWVRASVNNTNGVVLFGPGYGSDDTTTVQTLAGVDEPNPYGVVHWRPDGEVDRWYLLVTYVYPHNATGLTSQGGVYDGTTQVKLFTSDDFKWKSTTTNTAMRVLAVNCANTAVTYLAKPRVDVCDGSEATLQELLASGGTSGSNPINSVNSEVIIADGAITAPKINVAQLDALSATIGTLRTSTSGERVEISDNQITVYDSSNVVRVIIGNLA